MIKCDDTQCVLYFSDGRKEKFPFSKHGGKKGAKAAAHKREGQIQAFKKKALAVAADKLGAVEVMKFLVEQVGCDKLAETIEKAKKGKGWVPPPKGWTPASLAKYWKSMGGTVTACMKKAEGHVDDPAKFCASLKDRVTGKTTWRGPHKKKSFDEEAEEALSMLYKEETEPNEDETNLDEMLDDVNLEDLEAWLKGHEQPKESAEPEPEPEPGPEPEPEPDSAKEELQEVLREFDEESTFRNLIKWRFGGGSAPVLESEEE